MSKDTYCKMWCCMTETDCPKVKQHIGLAADSEGAINMVINHLMTSTYHKMGEDEANEQIGNMNIEEIDWNDEWGPKETYFAKKKQWETDEAATEPAAASWGRDDDWHGWDDQAGPYGKGKGKGSKGKGKKGKGGKRNRNDAGIQLCWTWNQYAGGCSEPCPGGRAHQCEICCGPHRTIEHK